MQTKTRTGKIARLPHSIRDELNRRLENNEPAKPILKWLNALPEVRTVLKEEFHGRAVTPQNLSEWKQGGFKDWQIRTDLIEFANTLDDENALGHKALASAFSEKLARWLTLRFAFAAQNLAAPGSDPNLEWGRLRELCADVARLRRGDLYAEHLRIQRDWLALEQSNVESLKEKQFWQWTERPEIKEKLWPDASRGITPEILREIEEKCLGMGGDEPFFTVGHNLRDKRLAKEAAAQQPPADADPRPGDSQDASCCDQPPSEVAPAPQPADEPSSPIQPNQT